MAIWDSWLNAQNPKTGAIHIDEFEGLTLCGIPIIEGWTLVRHAPTCEECMRKAGEMLAELHPPFEIELTKNEFVEVQ